jgi:GT2 family glycosyltransferase
LPVHNGAETLNLALDALLAQEYRDFVLLISDNASTDATPAICSRRAAMDDRIEYVRQRTNLGAARNFVEVLRRARTPYFMWAAHDDLWDPAFLGTLVSALECEPVPALACCDYDIHMHATQVRVHHAPESMPSLDPANGMVRTVVDLLRSPQPVFVYGLYRTEALDRFATQDGDPYDFSDLALLTEVALHGGIRFVPQVLFHSGVPGVAREPYSHSHRRLPGFKLTYGRYGRNSIWSIMRARSLSLRDRLRLTYEVLRQVAVLIHWHEWRSRPRP